MKLDVEEKVMRARIQLQVRFRWMMEALLKLEITKPSDGMLAYMDSLGAPAATDGKCFYYHPTRFLELQNEEAEFIYLHEVLHLVLRHPWRVMGRNPLLWNITTDMLINSMIVRLGYKAMPGLVYAPPEYEDSFAEKLYDLLMKEGGAQGRIRLGPADGGRGMPTTVTLQEAQNRLLTPHELWKGLEQSAPQQIQWENVSCRLQGSVPAGYGLSAELGQRTRIPWYRELGVLIKSAVAHDYSRTRFRRLRSPGLSYYMPRLISPHLRIVLAWDLSGSIGKEQRDGMAAESMGIIQSFDSYEILMIACDAAVHGYWYLHPGDELPLKEIKGGGGTDFRPVFEKVQELDFLPDCLVFFTDTLGTFPSEKPDYSVIWCVVGAQGKVPWGKHLEVILDD